MKVLHLAFTKTKRSKPELYVSDFCSVPEHQFYQQMIGILRWMIEIGRIDISVEVSYLSRYIV